MLRCGAVSCGAIDAHARLWLGSGSPHGLNDHDRSEPPAELRIERIAQALKTGTVRRPRVRAKPSRDEATFRALTVAISGSSTLERMPEESSRFPRGRTRRSSELLPRTRSALSGQLAAATRDAERKCWSVRQVRLMNAAPRPVPLRKGAIVRMSPGQVEGQAYLDLQFEDGHVERWLGSTETQDEMPSSLVGWGQEVAEQHCAGFIADMGITWGYRPRDAFDATPVEIVIENSTQM